MEGMPKLPMLCFQLKTSTGIVDLITKIKQLIRYKYDEDPGTFASELHEFQALQAAAHHPSLDYMGCAALKRYYCQLHFLQNRFSLGSLNDGTLAYEWNDSFGKGVTLSSNIETEMCHILYNIGALHSIMGASDSRISEEGMKMSCTHFQCGAWAFQCVRESYNNICSDLSTDFMTLYSNIMLAQAQECLLEKSMMDHRKSSIIAKVSAQIVTYYKQSLRILESKGMSDIIGSKMCKMWRKYLDVKHNLYNCIAYYYQGLSMEDQSKMGERVTYIDMSLKFLEEANKGMKGMDNSEKYQETLAFVLDVVGGKLTSCKKENELVYHEKVPEFGAVPEIKGASLVKGVPFSITDAEISGTDIFNRLVPMQAHESSSLYSEEKAKLLRNVTAEIEDKNSRLVTFISALDVNLDCYSQPDLLPEELVERCAAISVNSSAVKDLVGAMNKVSSMYHDMEIKLEELKSTLQHEERQEKEFQLIMGKRPPSILISELAKEAARYHEAHQKASESNLALHKAMSLQMDNLKILLLPIEDLQEKIPSIKSLTNGANDPKIKAMQKLLSKVEEMKQQRALLESQLRKSIQADDITNQIINSNLPIEEFIEQQLKKFEPQVSLLKQNLSAQDNILKALTLANADYAEIRQSTQEILMQRHEIVRNLISSYDTYQDLLQKAEKGVDFYKKLDENITKLLQRVKSVCKVQDEEREEAMRCRSNLNPYKNRSLNVSESTGEGGPKLKDYLNADKPKLKDYLNHMKTNFQSSQAIHPGSPVGIAAFDGENEYSQEMGSYRDFRGDRPAPVGSENVYSSASCISTTSKSVNSFHNSYVMPSNVVNSSPKISPQHSASAPSSSPSPHQSYPDQFYSKPHFGYNEGYGPLNPNQCGNNVQSSISYKDAPPANYSQMSTSNDKVPSLSTNFSAMSINPQCVNHPGSLPPQQVNLSMPMPLSETAHPPQAHYSNPYMFQQGDHPSSYSQHTPYHSSVISQQTGYTIPFSTQQTTYPTSLPSQHANYVLPQPPQVGNPISSQQENSLPISQPNVHSIPHPHQQSGYSHQLVNQQTVFPNPHHYYPTPYSTTSVASNSELMSGNPSLTPVTNQYAIPSTAVSTQCLASKETSVSPHIAGLTSKDHAVSVPSHMFTKDTSHEGNQYGFQSSNYLGSQAINTIPQAFSNIIPHSQPADSKSVNKSYGVAPAHLQASSVLSKYLNPNTIDFIKTSGHPEFNPNSETIQSIFPLQNDHTCNASALSQHYLPSTIPNHNSHSYQTPNMQSFASDGVTDVTFSKDREQLSSPNSGNYFASPYIHGTHGVYYHHGMSCAGNPTNYMSTSHSMQANANHDSQLYTSGNGVQSNTATTFNDTNTISKEPNPKSNVDLLSELSLDPTVPVMPVSSAYHNQDLKECLELPAMDTPSRLDQDVLIVDPHANIKDKNVEYDVKRLVSSDRFEGLQKVAPETKLSPAIAVQIKCSPEYLEKLRCDVDKLSKFIEGMEKKSLNGPTPLDVKWKDLLDFQDRESRKLSISVARCYPMKNRFPDILPFDCTRVELPSTKDDYINASHLRGLSCTCLDLIVTQCPLSSTYPDFWSMVFQEQVEVVVCLASTEISNCVYWPEVKGKPVAYGSVAVTLESVKNNKTWVERIFTLSSTEGKTPKVVLHLQLLSWNTNDFAEVSTDMVLFAQHVIDYYYQQRSKEHPVVIQCLSGVGKSGIFSIVLAAIHDLREGRGILDVKSTTQLAAKQRRGIIQDKLQFGYLFKSVLLVVHLFVGSGENCVPRIGVADNSPEPNTIKTLQHDGIHVNTEQTCSSKGDNELELNNPKSRFEIDVQDPLNQLDPLWSFNP